MMWIEIHEGERSLDHFTISSTLVDEYVDSLWQKPSFLLVILID